MMNYDVGLLALVPLLERFEFQEKGSVAFRLKNLEMGGIRFFSGVVRLQADTRRNGRH